MDVYFSYLKPFAKLRSLGGLCLILLGAPGSLHAAGVDFDRDISPILSQKCFACHGPDEEKVKGDLRLDLPDVTLGPFTPREGYRILTPGDPDNSELWRRIITTDPDEQMPPPESRHEPLNELQRQKMKEWISQGAKYEAFWAFAAPIKRPLPEVSNPEWMKHPIDRWVMKGLEENGMEASLPADPRALLRRLSFDLTGLPPSVEALTRFAKDPSETRYEEAVDRFLNSPQYGEHMAKYWLDLVRFADTNGLHHDHYRDMTPYRDWVIRAFNENLPFDAFISHQLAGDLYPSPTQDQMIASGFNRLHLIIDVGTALPEESYTRNVVDRVTAVGTAFMGLTVQCASCHDHKFDPITTKDFYQLFAFFNNFDGKPETGGRSGLDFKRGLQAPYIDLPSASQRHHLSQLDAALSELRQESKKLKQAVAGNESSPEAENLKTLEKAIQDQQKRRDALMMQVPAAMVMKEREEVRPAFILKRGVYDQYGDEVMRDTPSFLPAMPQKGETPSRLDLAQWMVRSDHPLTARVAVNRFWQQCFGMGLVKTSEDFGLQGERPSHPELLDYLARDFIESNWNLKRLMKQLVMSKTYRQGSGVSPHQRDIDPSNRWLGRGSRYRMDSEMIRDQIFEISGLLNPVMGGKSVKPPQPAKLWEIVAMPFSYPRVYEPDQGGGKYRRSLYTFWKRAQPPPQMSLFDAPSREACVARRERTNTPLQALMMMNEPEFFRAAFHMASQLLEPEGPSDDLRLARAYERVTSQLLKSREQRLLTDALGTFRRFYQNDPEAAGKLIEPFSGAMVDSEQTSEMAAWTMVVHSLFNLDWVRHRQ